MTVLLLVSRFAPHLGGVEEAVLNLGKALKNNQDKVLVVSAKAPRSLPDEEIIAGLAVRRLFLSLPTSSFKAFLAFPIFGLVSIFKLLQTIKRDQVKVLNLHFVDDAGFYALIVKLLTGVELVTSLHGNDVQKFPKESLFRKELLRLVLSQSNTVTVNSSYILEEVCKLFPWVRSKVTVIGNGINLEDFSTVTHYSVDKPYVLSLGRLVHKKGVDVIIRAWSKVKTDAILVIAGDGEERQNLENLSKSLNLTDRVTFLGKVDHQTALSLFAGALVFVLPSRIEPFGIVLLEAMASGCPILASATGGVLDLIRDGPKDGNTGFLFKNEDEADLTLKLQRMLNDPVRCKQLSETALRVVKDYTWVLVAKKYQTLFNRPVIAHVVSEFMPASQSYTYRQFINHLKYEVVVLSRFYFRGSKRFFPVAELHVMAHIGRLYAFLERRHPKFITWLFNNFVIWWVRQRNIRLLHVHFGTLGAKMARLKDHLKIPILVSFYGADTTSYPEKPEWRELYKEMFAKVDGFIALAETPKKQLIAIGAPADKCYVVAGSVDTDKLTYVTRSPKDGVKFLIVARLVEKKGYFVLLDAFKRVVDTGRNVKLNIVGFGFLKEKILARIRELGLENFVEFNDSSAVKDYFTFVTLKYQQADVFVLPSIVASDKDQEGTPLTILEASSTGLPVIGTDVAGVPEIINDGETGYIVEQRNVEALAEKMIYLSDHSEIRQRFGLAGRALVESKFSLKSLPDRLDAVYSNFIKPS